MRHVTFYRIVTLRHSHGIHIYTEYRIHVMRIDSANTRLNKYTGVIILGRDKGGANDVAVKTVLAIRKQYDKRRK